MNKIFLIIQREYSTRVRKKSFIIMTILGPILMASLLVVPVWLTNWSEGTEKNIAVLDEYGWFMEKLTDQGHMKFYPVHGDVDSEKETVLYEKNDMLLVIPRSNSFYPDAIQLFSTRQAGLDVTSYIKSVINKEIENKKLQQEGIDPELIAAVKSKIALETFRVEEDGAETKSFTEMEVGLAMAGGIMIYFFIFMFGAAVLKGVMEEKSNRIVEVIISSVKPFQLMMGKIVGVALVGLTQFLLWLAFTALLVGGFFLLSGQIMEGSGIPDMMQQNGLVQDLGNAPNQITAGKDLIVFEIINSLKDRIVPLVMLFLFYFLGGYFLYSSLFAAIGGAVDHDADTQQFMLPVSIPLIFSVMMSGLVINQPDSTLSFWLSIIPFTSPVIMMIRIPFGVPGWEILLSMVVLVLGFVASTWMAGKIYRTGILMYGQKVNYAVMLKWLKQK